MRIQKRAALFLMTLALLGPSVAGQAKKPAKEPPLPEGTDLFIGTWILSVEKSKFDPGPPHRGETRTFDYSRDGMLLVARQRVEADGQKSYGHWLCKLDGEFYPEFSRALGTKPVAWLAFKRVDARQIAITVKHDGVVDGDGSFTVSDDGKTLTYVLRGKNSRGQSTHTLRIYEKQ